MSENTFLQELIAKQAAVEQIGTRNDKNVSAAVAEVNRQIRQCLTGGDLRTGQGVTKSGKED